MRNVKAVLGLLAAICFLSACNAGEDTVLFDDGSLKADARLEEILDAISEDDRNSLEKMFSETAPSIDKGRYGFDGRKCAHTASSPLTIRQVFSAGLSSPGHISAPAKLLRT